MDKKEYTFVTLTYNHEKYIVEHLESIKYQILNFGESWNIYLIISDDFSRDKTLFLIDLWKNKNNHLFKDFNVIRNSANIGTCRNFTNTWDYIKTEKFKVLAGDDIYSENNILESSDLLKDNNLVSGIPLLLTDGFLSFSKSLVFNMVTTSYLYKNNFFNAMKFFSSINTPSLIYRKKYIESHVNMRFVNSFNVVEDFPFQIKIAETDPTLKYLLDNKVYVYYRRTNNSTYLIKNDKFIDDKVKQYQYLIDKEKSYIKKILLKNRIFCLKLNNPILKMLLNINFYVYGLKVIVNIFKINSLYKQYRISFENHQKHYNNIRKNTDLFLNP